MLLSDLLSNLPVYASRDVNTVPFFRIVWG
jgi:hypothetical protein